MESLAKGNKKIPEKRKGGSICAQYYRKRRRIQSESFKSPDLSFFDKCNKLQDHAILNHEGQVGDVMFGDCLANNFESIATTDLIDKSAHGCHESIQNDYINGPMREDGLCKLTENVCFLLRDDLMRFFDPGVEPKDDSHMHNGDSDDSSAATEVEYASLLSSSSKDYINCILNTEDTIDDIPNSQLLDSAEDVLEDPSFLGDRQDVCHCEDDPFHGDQQDVCHSEDDSFLGDQQDACHCEDDSPMHNDDSDDSSAATEVEYASLLSSSSKDYINCILNTEDTIDDIPNSQLLDSAEDVLEDPSFLGDQQDVCHSEDDPFDGDQQDACHSEDDPFLGDRQDVCHCEDDPFDGDQQDACHCEDDPFLGDRQDVCHCEDDSFNNQQDVCDCEDDMESTPISHLDPVHLSERKITCILNTEDPEIPCNDDIFLLFHPSPSTATESIDPTSSTQTQMDDPYVSPEFVSANPHVGYTLKSVSMDLNPSLSDHNDSDSDSDLSCFPDIEDPEIPILVHPSPSVTPQSAIDSIDLASCFTMDDPDLSFEFDYANPHVGCTRKSVSMDHTPSISDHNSESDLPCFPNTEYPEIPSPSVRPQTATYSIPSASSFTQSQIDGPDLSSGFDYANPFDGCTLKSVSMDYNPISEHNSESDLACFSDTEYPEIPSPSLRPQTATYSIHTASSFTQSQMNGPDLSSEFDSAHPHVGNTLKYVSVDHNPSISDHNNSDSDSDLPCFPDIEALIHKLDFEYAQESWIEVKRCKYKHYERPINRPEQSSSQRAMSSLGAFAVFYSHHFNYYIKKTEVTIGRSTDTEVDIDLRKESHANMISRQQATINMETDGTFTLRNTAKGSILVNGQSIAHGQVAALGSRCLIQIRGMEFMFEMNDRYVRWYLDNIIKKKQGKFTTFDWSVN